MLNTSTKFGSHSIYSKNGYSPYGLMLTSHTALKRRETLLNVPFLWSILCCCRFSPDGHYLAVGSADNCVDFYEIRDHRSLARAGYCKGIPSYVTQMDFSADGKFIQVTTWHVWGNWTDYWNLEHEALNGRHFASSLCNSVTYLFFTMKVKATRLYGNHLASRYYFLCDYMGKELRRITE